MDLRLYDTLTRKKEVFRPIDPSNVRMYVCGPTVYQRIHIGNARPLVVFDVLFRLLRHLYGEDKVTYVRNITDIDDRIIDQARKDGVNGDLNAAVRALTDTTTEAFREDWRALGCLPPTHEPRATDHIPGMIRIIGELIEKGHAYAAEGHVLFHVPSMPAYGRLSGRSLDDMIAGARVEVAPYKRHPADFVLWKPSTPDLPGWDSPWGRGRPGWHIECSAMSEALLGLPFDIHGGGQDLIFPHHENEIAQSCCAHGLDGMASVWMHNGFVDMRGEKMSKSVGNVIRAHKALELADVKPFRRGEAVRMWMLTSHYRQPLDFEPRALHQAHAEMRKLYFRRHRTWPKIKVEPDQHFIESLIEDLNTPKARERLFWLASASRSEEDEARLRATGKLIGIFECEPEEWLPEMYEAADTLSQRRDVRELVDAREKARRARDYQAADVLRDRAVELGVRLVDRPDGTTEVFEL